MFYQNKNHASGPIFHTEHFITIKGTKENFKGVQNVFLSIFVMLTCCFDGGVLCVSMLTTTSHSWSGAAWHTEQNVSIAELPHLLVLVLVDLQSQQEVLVLHGEGEHKTKQPWSASSACSQSKQRNKLPLLLLQTHSAYFCVLLSLMMYDYSDSRFFGVFLSSEREFDPV